ncbi:MAG: PQQ-binding-like beta-propeller repeat protein, partial [Verrucomicrobia bacterium]|nr:PQQ-binding-like beta-propeller repeat protein [Verrucomicrobiota bacterium]
MIRKSISLLAAFGFTVVTAGVFGQAVNPLAQWGQWRGPLATGAAPKADPPVEWSETENIRWKTKLPGLGHSSPVVWGGLVFVTAAEMTGAKKPFTGVTPDGAHNNMNPLFDHQFAVTAIDRQTGAVVWRRTVATRQPHESSHESATWASNSPVTDGEHVLSFFGSNGLYCLDTGGRLVWSRDLGDMQVKHGHGEGASPLLHGETVVVNWDHEGASLIVALAKRTGEELWRQPRDELTSWATPIVVTHDGQAQVVVSGTRRVRGYDLKTGA